MYLSLEHIGDDSLMGVFFLIEAIIQWETMEAADVMHTVR